MEYQVPPATSWRTDQSEMFVLMSLIFAASQCLVALVIGMDRPMAALQRAKNAPVLAAHSRQHPLAPIPAPTQRLTI
jgi:hypothetical protein